MRKFLAIIFCFLLIEPCVVFAKKSKSSKKTETVSEKKTSSKKKAKAEKKTSSKKEGKAAKAEKKNNKRNKSYDIEDLEEDEIEVKKSRKEKKAEKKAKKQAKKEAKKNKKDAKNSETDNSSQQKEVGAKDNSEESELIKTGRKNTIEKGIVRLDTITKNASVIPSITSTGKKNSWIPIIETNDSTDSTYISVFIDKTEYRLNRSNRVKHAIEIEQDSITVIYNIAKIAELRAVYSFERSDNAHPEIESDSILVSYSLRNTDTKVHAFALKAVYNTYLGESRYSHFDLPNNTEALGETVIKPSKRQSWFSSGDGKHIAKFLIFGKGVTPPQKAVLANKDVVEDASFETGFKEGRSFNSLLSYNNSSIGLFWDAEILSAKRTRDYSYKIVMQNLDLLIENGEEDLAEDYEVEKKIPEEKKPEKEEVVLVPADKSAEPEVPSQNLNYDFDTDKKYVDSSLINAEYIQQLINEINALEHSDPALNRARIQQLQMEINDVLKVLRSRK